MSNHDFILKSGAKYHVTEASLEEAANLTHRVQQNYDPSRPDVNISMAVFDPKVREVLMPLFRLSSYNDIVLTSEYFSDPKWKDKLKADYIEMATRLIEVNCTPFFLNLRSKSEDSPKVHSESPVSS